MTDGVRAEWRVTKCHRNLCHVGFSAPRGRKRADLLIWFVVTWAPMANGPCVTFNRRDGFDSQCVTVLAQ